MRSVGDVRGLLSGGHRFSMFASCFNRGSFPRGGSSSALAGRERSLGSCWSQPACPPAFSVLMSPTKLASRRSYLGAAAEQVLGLTPVPEAGTKHPDGVAHSAR